MDSETGRQQRDGQSTNPVQLVRWPSEAVRRDELAALGVPRLLLVEEGHLPPAVTLGIEDWIRVPADERDLFVRMARLERRHRLHLPQPVLDDLVLRNGERWIALSATEAGMVAPLLRNFGRLVTTDEIGASAWDDGVPRSLRSRLRHLRKKLAEVGLRIVTVRGRGFILELDLDDQIGGSQ